MQLIDDFKDLENADPSIIRGACLTVDELGL